jgi:hypothetical protein
VRLPLPCAVKQNVDTWGKMARRDLGRGPGAGVIDRIAADVDEQGCYRHPPSAAACGWLRDNCHYPARKARAVRREVGRRCLAVALRFPVIWAQRCTRRRRDRAADLPLSTTTLTGRILITSSSGWADDVATSI